MARQQILTVTGASSGSTTCSAVELTTTIVFGHPGGGPWVRFGIATEWRNKYAYPTEDPGISQQTTALLRKEGDFWAIEFEGRVTRVKSSRSLAYLARLLAQPGVDVYVLDLVHCLEGELHQTGNRGADWVEDIGAVSRHPGQGPGEAVLDASAMAAYKQRLKELSTEQDEAIRWGDTERAARIREDLEFLEDELTRAVGMGGRSRRTASAHERARVAVTKAIHRAIKDIALEQAALGAHLANTVKTGSRCVYAPEPHSRIEWSFC